MSIKALLDYVLEEVAIDGEEGTTIPQLFLYVNDFYVKNRQKKQSISLLCPNPFLLSTKLVEPKELRNDSVKSRSEDLELWGLPNVREVFQDYIWELLRKEKDFSVGKNNEGGHMSLKEIVNDLKNNKSGGKEKCEPARKAEGREHDKWKVYASEERRWRTLTGHGVDTKKVPNAVFKCLEVVGKHREDGIIQPELTKITGQDKKSVAGRTTLLKQLGYIEKMNVLAKNLNTSKLTLTKFVIQRDLKRRAVIEANESQSKKKGKKKAENVASNTPWTGDTIDTEKLIKATMVELKSAKNRVLMHSDLKRKLGMDKSRFHWRSFSRILRRIERLGVLKRIRVPLKILRTYKKKEAETERTITEECHARCVKYVRDMQPWDWRRVLTAFSKRELVMEEEEEDFGASEDEGQKGEKDAEEVDAEAIKELADVSVEAVEEVARDLPQWIMHKPLTNIIFDLVDSAGKDGITSMDLMQRTIGPFYYRPMDQILHRMTDFPTQSQPPQYMHLAVIRETGISGRQTHYRYFSYRWHQELVTQGVAVEPWGSQSRKKGSKQGSVRENPHTNELDPETDQYGFPAVDASRLVKKDGSGTLAESQLQGTKKENLTTLTAQFSIGKDDDADWRHATPRGGRPRKYEKGKEPYLAGKRRAAAKREAQAQQVKKASEVAGDSTPINEAPSGRKRRKSTSANSAAGSALGSEATPLKTRGRIPKEQKLGMEATPEVTPLPKRRGRPPANSKNAKSTATAPKTPSRGRQQSKNSIIPSTPNECSKINIGTSEGAPSLTPQKEITTSTRKRKGVTPTRASKRLRNGIEIFFQSKDVSTQATSDSSAMIETAREVQEIAKEVGTTTDDASNFQTISSQSHERSDSGESMLLDSASTLPNSNPICGEEMAVEKEQENECSQGNLEHKTIDETGDDIVFAADKGASPGPSAAEPINSTHDIDGTTLEIEHLDIEGNESYGSIGGMLALSRQQIVLDLLEENGGVFPSGNELRHAFNKRYHKINPKAGTADRRLIRGVIQSLQYKGRVNQITFTFVNSRGVSVTKKLLSDINLPLDSPLIRDMTKEMIAADGNLWFPPNTELHPDIQERFNQPPSWSLPKPREVEGVEFERMYPSSVQQLKMKRAAKAADRAAANAIKIAAPPKPRGRPPIYTHSDAEPVARRSGKFTVKQKEEAAQRRKAEIKAERALLKLNRQYRTETFNLDSYDPLLNEENIPKQVWWNDFVDRDGTAPRDGKRFLQKVHEVEKWEKKMEKGKTRIMPVENNGMIMINHFAPEAEVGENFVQAPVSSLDDRIRAPDFDELPTVMQRKPGPKPGTKQRLKAPKKQSTSEDFTEPDGTLVAVRRKRRPPGSVIKNPSRRERAMAAIRENTLEAKDAPLEELPPRKFQYRNQYLIPKEDEDSLLIAIIIARTLFGGWDRKIDWNLVQKAIPKHSATVLQKRWPRVRDTHKVHMKKLQAEFEEMFLEAYSSNQLPKFNSSNPSSFDLPFHVRWFRENLELPESQSVPELPRAREGFDSLYELRTDGTPTWRAEFHSPVLTMGNRGNHFVCHPYEMPLNEKERSTEDEPAVEYLKSVVKANVITYDQHYQPDMAFKIMHSFPENLVDTAFYKLSISKTIAHKKDNSRLTPGRNYEFTDRFHMSLRTPLDEKFYAQAVDFEDLVHANFSTSKELEISEFTNDGSMACLLDMIANRRIILTRKGYIADELGLIEGYQTRGMDKKIVDFTVKIKPGPSFKFRPKALPEPPIPCKDPDNSLEPIRLWYDLNGNLVDGMWLKVLTATLALVMSRPGIQRREITRVLWPGMTLLEVEEVVSWLEKRGALEYRCDGDKKMGCWPTEAGYLSLRRKSLWGVS